VVLAVALAATLAVPASAVGSVGARPELPTRIGSSEGKLVMLAWKGYLDPLWVRPFVRRSGCKIHSRYVSSSGQLVRLMRAQGGRYDMVSASGDVSRLLVSDKTVAPVNTRLVPGWKDFLPPFKSPEANTAEGVHYGISLHWAPNTLLYNWKRVRPAPRSWGALYNPRYSGAITVPNNPLQIADAALYLMTKRPALGIRDPYELTRPQFAAAVELLERQKPLLTRYWSYAAEEIRDFRRRAATIGVAWPYQVAMLKKAKVPVADVTPREGMTGWIDSWMISAKTKHPNCAYRWLRYVSTPKVQAQQAVRYGVAPVNRKACPFMNALHHRSCATYRLNAPPSYFRSISFWKTPLAGCDWEGRGNCVSYADWQRAWMRITG
jgi:putative spermidine/putrescine transport system substrate-binding protein